MRKKDKKTLVIVADDFGYGKDRNSAMLECFKTNSITTTSLLVNCKHSEAGAKLLARQQLPVGLHFNLTEGGPVSKPELVASLVNEDGRFMGKQAFWAADVDPEHVRTELRSQIARFAALGTGAVPYRVDGHQHCHVHSDVVGPFADVLAEFSIKQTRLPLEFQIECKRGLYSSARAAFHRLIAARSLDAKEVFERHGVHTAAAFVGMDFMGALMVEEDLKEVLAAVFDLHRSCEFMVHPGKAPCCAESDGFTGESFADEFSRSLEREHELKVLQSDGMQKFYEENNVVLQSGFL